MYDSPLGLSASARTKLTPTKFYAIVNILKGVDDSAREELDGFLKTAEPIMNAIDGDVRSIAQANNDLVQELRVTTKHRDPFKRDQEQDFSNYTHSMSRDNFVRVAYDMCQLVQTGYHIILAVAGDLYPRELIISDEVLVGSEKKTVDVIQKMMYEMQLNEGAVTSFLSAIERLDNLNAAIANLAVRGNATLERYYSKLSNRHSVEGVEIFRDAIITDVAMSIYENVDSHGEIENGKKPDEISAYTLRKAELIGKALKNGLLSTFVSEPTAFLDFIKDNLRALWKTAASLQDLFKEQIKKVKGVVGGRDTMEKKMSEYDFNDSLDQLLDLDPRNVVYKEKTVILSSEERFNLKFRNETLKRIVDLLSDKQASVQQMIDYILTRKSELRAFFQDENSFYVCKIGAGNPFLGDAPGALQVVPGERPSGRLDEIVGSGFDDVKAFIQSIEDTSKWHDLFLATSPSRTADKSNVLLVGPQGCGKSEVLRAVGGDKKSIGVFAQGSDFLTCWKGEADKNPKRLFEAGLKLQKESRKHVHFLIDEIDSVLNDDKEMGSNNLTLEFQILMDGVVRYPNLSVWGATNNPDRIPMPMIRRFSKVLIVGELSQKDRIHLLKHFVSSFLPTRDFNDTAWDAMAMKLEGATGDVMRKVADHVWRTKMGWFVTHLPAEAEKLVNHLNHGEKFQIADFDEKGRRDFKSKLSQHMAVVPADVDHSIDIHLKNLAIRAEIATAKDTYARAKRFLENVNSGEV